jgi:serine/threonine protein kinase
MAEGASEKYRLGERIGGGGMAEVFEATLVGVAGFARPVAVKRMLPSLSSDLTFGEMFVNEARIASLLQHANIVTVLDFDRDQEGRYFLVMELIRGMDLRQLADSGRLPAAVAVHIGCEMLRGLDYAHELEHEGRRLGIVHRDISPHNVMISWDGAVKLVDFGIAKAVAATGASRTGSIKGKLAYMSPEQAGALELDGRSDLFAVGVVLHELLVGQRLFRGSTEPEVLARVLTQPIPRPSELRPDVPADLDAAIMSLLERDRDRRCASAHQALEVLLSSGSSSARGGLELERLLSERFPDRGRKRRPATAGSGAPLLATPTAPTAVPEAHPARSGDVTARGPGSPSGTPPPPVAPSGSEATLPARPAALQPQTWAAPNDADTPPPRDRPRRPWRAGLVVVLAAAAVTAGALIARNAIQGDEPEPAPLAAIAAPPDAGSPLVDAAAAEPDAAPVQPSVDRPRDKPRERDREPGILHVTVQPWAEVIVDGKLKGPTPQTVRLSPGPHKLLLRNREVGKHETVPVTIQSGKTISIDRDWK